MKKCKNKCITCKYFKRCGGCSVCEALICKSKCGQCTSICTKKENISAYLNSFGNLDISLTENNYIELPSHIPIIRNRLKNPIDIDYVALHAGNVLSNNGEKVLKRLIDRGYTDLLNLKPSTKAILEFYVKDKYLEGFWDNRYSIYKSFKTLGFAFVLSPNFSVYDDSPRIDHLYNIKRNTIVYNELLDIGINAVPDVSWYNRSDLDYWINEINKNKIKIVSFSFQNVGVGLKPSNIWKHSLLGFRYFCSNISNDVDIIIAGIVSPFRISEIYQTIKKSNRLIVLSQSAYMHSIKGILSETRLNEPNFCFNALFERNIDYYNKIYEDIYKSNRLYNLSRMPKNKLIQLYKKINSTSELENDTQFSNFLFRCLRKKRVSEVILSQKQDQQQ